MKLIIIALIALAITAPWLIHPGMLFLLDWQGSPFIVFGILILSGISMAKLVSLFTPAFLPSLIAVLFYMTNPFVFNRITMGHVNLLFAYALAPLAIYSTIRFLKHSTYTQAILASALYSLMLYTSIHFIFLLPIIIGLFLFSDAFPFPTIPTKKYAVLLLPALITATIALTTLTTNPTSSIHGLTSQDLPAFAPRTVCSNNILLDTLTLNAQWRTVNASQFPCNSHRVFFITSITLLLIMLIGAWQKKILALGAFVLIGLTLFPFIPAMRDSAKYLADLAIIESILLALGIATISKKYNSNIVSIIAIFLVCVAGLPMLWGLSSTISPQQYPNSWYQIEQQFALLPQKPTVLFLPWHLYMPFDFTNGKTIANPAQRFFTHANIIQGDNLEIKQDNVRIQTESRREVSQKVESVIKELQSPEFPPVLQELLQAEHIQYIFLAHGSPEEEVYRETLDNISFLHKTVDAKGLTVWQVE